MTEIEIAGELYRINKLPAMRQFHIVRKIGMLLTGLTAPEGAGNIINFGEGGSNGDGEESFEAVMRYVSPLLLAAGTISDTDTEYVILNCLRVVERRQPGPIWSRVVVGEPPMIMFADISQDLALMMQLVWAVLKENLSNFFAIAGQMARGNVRSPAA